MAFSKMNFTLAVFQYSARAIAIEEVIYRVQP